MKTNIAECDILRDKIRECVCVLTCRWRCLQLFTVVRNVKQAHECLEHGETQDFQDDVDYIMDGLDDTQPMSIRCLRYRALTR